MTQFEEELMVVERRAIRVAGVDWVARWRDLVEQREGQAEAALPPSGNRWDGRAGRFARMADELDAAADPLVLALKGAIRPGDTLIDAGAGAGRYTVPFAGLAAHVTAVEPSGGMRAALAKTIEARGLTNVSIVAGTWQEAVVEPHDVVVCSHVVYFVRDIEPFLEKLDASARRACFVYVRVDARDTPLSPLWREVRGEDRAPEAGFLDLYNVLFSLGIRSHVQFSPHERGTRYADLEDAVEQTRQALGLGAGEVRFDDRIRTYLEERLLPDGAGLAFPPFMQTAIVSWEK